MTDKLENKDNENGDVRDVDVKTGDGTCIAHFGYPLINRWPFSGWGEYRTNGETIYVVFNAYDGDQYQLFRAFNLESLQAYRTKLEELLGCDLRLRKNRVLDGVCMFSPTKSAELDMRELFLCAEPTPLTTIPRSKFEILP